MKIEVTELKVNAEEIQKLANAVLEVGIKYKPDPKVFFIALKAVEKMIEKGIEQWVNSCDCENCSAERNINNKEEMN